MNQVAPLVTDKSYYLAKTFLSYFLHFFLYYYFLLVSKGWPKLGEKKRKRKKKEREGQVLVIKANFDQDYLSTYLPFSPNKPLIFAPCWPISKGRKERKFLQVLS